MQLRISPQLRNLNPRSGILVSILACFVGVLYFYRGFFFTSFGLAQGNYFDGRLTQTIALHWAQPFQFGDFNNLGIFFPFDRALMYSDTFLLFGPSVALLSVAGASGSVAFQSALIIVTAVGYFSLIALFRLLRCGWWLSITGAAVAIFSNGMLIASAHPQLITVHLVPVCILFGLLALRSNHQSSQFLFSASSSCLTGLVLYSAFYVGWTIILSGVVLLFFLFVFAWRSTTQFFRSRISLAHLVGTVIGLAFPLILAMYTYLPLLLSGTERSLDDAAGFALQPKDLLGVSPTNILWSPVFTRTLAPIRDEEFAMSPTPFLLLASFLLSVWALRHYQRRSWIHVLGLSLLVTGFVFWLLPVRWGSFLPWTVVYEIPGASAIRAIGRVEIVSGLFLVLGATLLASQLIRNAGRRTLGLISIGVVLIVLEQANHRVQQHVDVAEMTSLQSTPTPDLPCRSFFISPPLDARKVHEYQIDPVLDSGITAGITAQIVAQATGIPSVNGYSGGSPSEWPLTKYEIINPSEYQARLNAYIEEQDLTDVCGFSTATSRWFSYRN